MKTCLVCNKILVRPSKETYKQFKDRKYCSRKCCDIWKKGKIIPPSRKGTIPWNKNKKGLQVGWANGKKFTKTHRENISKGHKGIKRSLETRIKLSQRRGEKAGGWRGGLTSINKLIRSSLEYKLWRKAVFERDNFTCIWCLKRGGELNADHIKSFADYPELRFAIDNGRTLCRECHLTTETYGNRNRKKNN